jgi:outer membrane protein OmpA-like peptidoglycan-associated protein
MLKGVNILILLIVFFSCGVNKDKGITPSNIADCEGAINLFQAGTSVVDLPGTSGKKDEFSAYQVLKDVDVLNSVWFSFIADYDGKFTLRADTEVNDLNLVVFQTDGRNMCDDIASGKAEIKRMLIKEDYPSVWLTERNIKNALYPIQLRKGDKINFVIFTKKKRKTRIKLYIELLPSVVTQIVNSSDNKIKIVDLTDDFTANKTRIEVRNVETGDPVIANIRLKEMSDLEGSYRASDLIFQPAKTGLLKIECSEDGYFFVDRGDYVNPSEDKTITIYFQRLLKGKSMQLGEIQFKPNSSELLSSAEPVLTRLREFLALNADIEIEIQGHVFEKNTNSSDGMSMSNARAQRVMKYLVNSGINEKRMTAVGYGGTRPVFANPTTSAEEQANRRVEILIL